MFNPFQCILSAAHYLVLPAEPAVTKSIPPNGYLAVDDYRTVLSAHGLSQCAAIAVVAGSERILLHIYQSNLMQRMRLDDNRFYLKAPRCGALLQHIGTTLSSHAPAQITVVLGTDAGDADRFIQQEYNGGQPIMDLMDTVGPDNIRFYRGGRLDVLRDGSIAGLTDEMPLDVRSYFTIAERCAIDASAIGATMLSG